MELEIVKFFNKYGGRNVSLIAVFVSRVRMQILLWAGLAFAVLLLDKANGRLVFLGVMLALLLHFVFSEGFFKLFMPKYFFTRKRPYVTYPEIIESRGSRHQDSSFPSSHMSTALAVLTVLVYSYPPIWPIALFFTIFMAYARMHTGMHYPSDVLAGTVFGIIYGVIAIYLVG